MKKLVCCCFFSSVFFVQTFATNNRSDKDKMQPTIVAKISQTAINKAASPDGLKGILGLAIGPQKFEGATTGGQGATEQKMNICALTAGVEYAKSFKNKLFLAIQLLADAAPKKKKKGAWSDINQDFDSQAAGMGNRKGQLQTDIVTPSLGIKAGYLFRKHRCVAYMKLGISRISGKYVYDLNDQNFASVSVNAIAPNIAIGGEYRINSKIGAGMEIGFPIKKKVHKKVVNGIEHRSKISRIEIRLLGTYTISKPDSMPKSLSDFEK